MGLDMYLYKVTHINAEWEGDNLLIDINIENIKQDKRYEFNINKISSISEEIGYWRKANQIHNWFVHNIQDNVDNCAYYYVSDSSLIELRKKCIEALSYKDKVLNEELSEEELEKFEEILPTQGGFFFGNTAYSYDYFAQLKDTIDILEDIDKYADDYNISFMYHSSW